MLLAAAAGIWSLLGRMDDDVAWLTVEAPGHAVAGVALPLRVRVTGLKEPTQLAINLHGSSVRDGSNDFLSPGGARLVGKEGGRFDFEIMVHPRADLHFVNAILFLSPNGDWKDHTFAATTELIPVTNAQDGDVSAMRRLAVHPLVRNEERANGNDPAFPRLIVGLVLLAGSVMAFAGSKPHRGGWLVLAAMFALAAAWELLGVEGRVGTVARAWARAADVYYPREIFQKAVISLTFACVLGFLVLAWGRRKSYQPALLFFGLYLGITVVNLLSLHSLDVYAGHSCHGVNVVDALKLFCAAATLLCVLRARSGRRTGLMS